MQFYRDGSSSITDEDEEYEDNGRLELSVDSEYIHQLMHDALKLAPALYDTELFNLLSSVQCGEENIGICCDIEFRSNSKVVICPKCGQIVHLT